MEKYLFIGLVLSLLLAAASALTLEDAIAIAEDSGCMQEGKLTESAFYNNITFTWWIDLGAELEGCAPACVVSEETETAEVNWRCTGAVPTLYGEAAPESGDSMAATAPAETKATPVAPAGAPAPMLFDPTVVILALGALGIFVLVFKLSPGMHLNQEDFSALSAEKRTSMLNSLSQRRKTLTELSKEENISLPTAKQHLEKLEKTGFVEKKDEGRKWKYYELTKKGKRLLDQN